MTILVGTASWTDKTLLACGRFYPKTASSAEARLRFYAAQFPIVEVDSSYYAIPAPATAQLWAERTPEGFVMNVKAFRLFTGHQTIAKVMEQDLQPALARVGKPTFYYRDLPGELIDELWRRFRNALLPLRAAGRLGLVHFQFPPWLVAGADGREHVALCARRMEGFDVGVEFRHGSWFDGDAGQRRTLDFLRKLGVAHTVVDGPQGFANSVPQVWAATHDRFALVRLHGHNRDTWNVRGLSAASERFNYDYPEAELAGMVPRLTGLAATVLQTHVVFNNNMEDQGQRNARTLTGLLAAAGVAVA